MKKKLIFSLFCITIHFYTIAQVRYTKKLDSIVYIENSLSSKLRFKTHYQYSADNKLSKRISYYYDTLTSKYLYSYEDYLNIISDSLSFNKIVSYTNGIVRDTDYYKNISHRSGFKKVDSSYILKNNSWMYSSRDETWYNPFQKIDSFKSFIGINQYGQDSLIHREYYEYDSSKNLILKFYTPYLNATNYQYIRYKYNNEKKVIVMYYGNNRADSGLMELLRYDNAKNLDSVLTFFYNSSLKYYEYRGGYTKFKYNENVDIKFVLFDYSNEYYGKPFNQMLSEESENWNVSGYGRIRKFYYSDVVYSTINQKDSPKLAIFPNPASERVILEINETAIFKLYNLLGQVIIEKWVYPNESVELNSLHSGLYRCFILNKNKQIIFQSTLQINK